MSYLPVLSALGSDKAITLVSKGDQHGRHEAKAWFCTGGKKKIEKRGEIKDVKLLKFRQLLLDLNRPGLV